MQQALAILLSALSAQSWGYSAYDPAYLFMCTLGF